MVSGCFSYGITKWLNSGDSKKILAAQTIQSIIAGLEDVPIPEPNLEEIVLPAANKGNFARHLAMYIGASGLQETKLAQQIGVHRNTILYWKQGKYLTNDPEKLVFLLRLLQLSKGQQYLLLAEAGISTQVIKRLVFE